MRRMPIPVRIAPFLPRGCPQGIYAGLARLSAGCPPDRGRLHTCYSPVRRSPAESASTLPAAPRLACVKPAASVHPEPGSNSPLFLFFFRIFSLCFVLGPACCRLTGNPRLPSLFPISRISPVWDCGPDGHVFSLYLVLWHCCHCAFASLRYRCFSNANAKLQPFCCPGKYCLLFFCVIFQNCA